MAKNPEVAVHQVWLGLLQPVGLVVSAPALVKAQAVPRSNVAELQQELVSLLSGNESDEPRLDDFPSFAERILGWQLGDLAGAEGGPELPAGLELPLPNLHETLRPTHAVLDLAGGDDEPRKVLMLVNVVPAGTDLDAASTDEAHAGWQASPQAKLERLMREREVPAGLLFNGEVLRLVHAPRGESSGHLSFPVAAMAEVAGRPILAACEMLLCEDRVFSAPDGTRLLDLLRESRKYQNEVSTQLAGQVLGALWSLLAGFQAADVAAQGQVFGSTVEEEPEHVYGGLLTVLMRLVFLLYAEDQGLMPDDAVSVRNYSVTGLFERLRADAGRYPDTMDQRHGAWAALLSLFRLVHDGGGHEGEGCAFRLPARHGELFNPDQYPFLEGRPRRVARVMGESFPAPRVSDGTIQRVLEALLVLDGERLSYRGLDVEQIGSVYEAIMGFSVERAHRRSIAVKPKDVVLDVDALLEVAPGKRKKHLKDETECDLSGAAATALKDAKTAEDVVAALGRKVSPRTPRLLPAGSLYLQPGEERRRTGSHYTPRELTEPIVRTTLRPVLESLGERPTPEQILALEVCDPAMGSGAFLVETCRQLAEALVEAWTVHDETPTIPSDEDPLLHARRMVAQRCLHGVDKNPFAVSLAKLSLWLVTLAKDHAFTFLDHALKHGDSLVGLTRKQIERFRWDQEPDATGTLFEGVADSVRHAGLLRDELQDLDEGDYDQQREVHRRVEEALSEARLIGDLVIAAFFSSDKKKLREERREELHHLVSEWKRGAADEAELREIADGLRGGERPLPPFHWEVEFPEVFGRENPGFDAMVGNPPFAGKNTLASGNREAYGDWLKTVHEDSHGNSDLVAQFFRRAFWCLREGGCFGLIATNTIGQGDTRHTGLRFIATHGGTIYSATKRLRWPGAATVVVSVVHVGKAIAPRQAVLDGREVETISAFLFHAGGHESPARLVANKGKSFIGSYVLGMGFTFDDTDTKGVASSLADMQRLIEKDPRNAERIFPYIGGAELNESPTQSHHRYVINFGEMSEDECRAKWPDLMAIVEARVRPEREAQGDRGAREKWWQFIRTRPELQSAIADLQQVLVIARVSNSFAFTFVPTTFIFNEKTVIIPTSRFAALSVLQGRLHETWARAFSSSLKDDMQYTPSDCFETFPFPPGWESNPALEDAGRTYHDYRAKLMVESDKGLTNTYNRFHDPNERYPDIMRLRELHAEMDRAVLDAYGWTDIPTASEFLLDYEIDEETWGTKRKPYRYRWLDDIHDEVLARLLGLNRLRANEERLSALAAKESLAPYNATPKPKRTTKRRARLTPDAPLLPGVDAIEPKTDREVRGD